MRKSKVESRKSKSLRWLCGALAALAINGCQVTWHDPSPEPRWPDDVAQVIDAVGGLLDGLVDRD